MKLRIWYKQAIIVQSGETQLGVALVLGELAELV